MQESETAAEAVRRPLRRCRVLVCLRLPRIDPGATQLGLYSSALGLAVTSGLQPATPSRLMSEILTLGKRRNEGEDEGMAGDDHEEEFYYTEVEIGLTSPLPTLSHRDMARPAHEDPEYQKALSMGSGNTAGPISIPSNSWPVSAAISPSCSQKQIKLSVSAPSSGRVPSSPSRRLRGDTKKCRKVYGMEHRDLWCTQCKWKKACTRFGD
ncbi:unnamed protein product [Nezara viridula]|uniref:Uncharacterized protein n=1 Tax=Nezara viridula TaxID=85310 RepID=A0A9P0MSZ2_NEZVI|nr:unnamed protein product [Nezara viridula]